jgi:hypothetical protein
MTTSTDEAPAATAAAKPLRQVRAFTEWVGAGRKLTQTGGAQGGVLAADGDLDLWARLADEGCSQPWTVARRARPRQREGARSPNCTRCSTTSSGGPMPRVAA